MSKIKRIKLYSLILFVIILYLCLYPHYIYMYQINDTIKLNSMIRVRIIRHFLVSSNFANSLSKMDIAVDVENSEEFNSFFDAIKEFLSFIIVINKK